MPKTKPLKGNETRAVVVNSKVKANESPQPAASKQKKEFVNKVENSEIKSISINSEGIWVWFKNGSYSLIVNNRIVHFMNKARADETIDAELYSHIKVKFKSLFNGFDPLEPHLKQVDVDALYKHIYEIIVAAKNAAYKARKPLLTLFGESHYSQYSLLCEFIVFDILERMGLKTICFELPDNVQEADILAGLGSGYYGTGYTCQNISFMYFLAKRKQFETVFIDDEIESNNTYIMLKFGRAIDEKLDWALSYKKFDILSYIVSSSRDLNLSLKLALTSFDPGRKEQKQNVKRDLRMAIIGSNHLRGIAKNPTIASMYYVLPISTGGDMNAHRAYTQHSTYNKKSLFFRQSSPQVIRLRTDKDCSCYTNLELYEKVLMAKKAFLEERETIFKQKVNMFVAQLESIETLPLTTIEVGLCLNLRCSVLAICEDNTLVPDFKCIELRLLLNETRQILRTRGLADKNLSKGLQIVIANLGDIPLLNSVEYRQAKKSSFNSTKRLAESAMQDILDRHAGSSDSVAANIATITSTTRFRFSRS